MREPIREDNRLARLPTWGPSFRVSFSLLITSFDGDNLFKGKWAELLRFTNTDNNCCRMGDRIPAIFTNKNGFIQVATQNGQSGNKWTNVPMETRTWYQVDLLQYNLYDKVASIYLLVLWWYLPTFQFFSEIKLDGESVVRIENENPRQFRNVGVWAAKTQNNFPPAKAFIGNLEYGNLGVCVHKIINMKV